MLLLVFLFDLGFFTCHQKTSPLRWFILGFFSATASTFWDFCDAQRKYLCYILTDFLLTNNPVVSVDFEDLFLLYKKEGGLISCCLYMITAKKDMK